MLILAQERPFLSLSECDRFYPDSNDKTRFACLCSSKRCDEFGEVPMLERGAKVGLWYRTSRGGDRLAQYNININGDAKGMDLSYLSHFSVPPPTKPTSTYLVKGF